MKHSIRIRFTMIFTGLMAAALLTFWMINSFFLESYYMKEKVKILEFGYQTLNTYIVEKREAGESISRDLDSLFSEDGEQNEISRLVRLMMEKYNVTMAIVDSVDGTMVVPAYRDARFLADQLQQLILGIKQNRTETLVSEENYRIQKRFDGRSQGYYLQNWGFFDDNRTMFIMSMPVAAIRDSVELSNRFLAYVGLAVLATGSILMYFVSRKVTNPILSLAALSARMSNLDFEVSYTGDSQDEIGILGQSMNTLSATLKETIGELKTVNNELQKDIEEKIRIDEARKDFIANVSHELKTPIALIQGYAEGLTEGMAEDPDSRDYYCEVIMDEAGKMNRMVKQLLTLTALEFGNDLPVMEQFDIVSLIQGILASVNILIQQKEVTVEFASEGPVYVWADEFKIEEVITNYVNNAMNHAAGEKRIKIQIEQQEKEVKVTVFNTGAPIPEEGLEKLWTKFYKADKARTRAYGGSGIGLSIVKAIMESHHKEYGVENRENGVAFWFTLDGSAR